MKSKAEGSPAASVPRARPWRDELWETHLRVGFPGSDEDVRFLVLGLCGEVGELANLIKKQWRRDDYPAEKRRQEIVSEFADVRAYLYMIGRALGIDEEAAVAEHVIPKCRARWPRPPEGIAAPAAPSIASDPAPSEGAAPHATERGEG